MAKEREGMSNFREGGVLLRCRLFAGNRRGIENTSVEVKRGKDCAKKSR